MTERVKCTCTETVTHPRSWLGEVKLHTTCRKMLRINNNEAEVYIARRLEFQNRSDSLSGRDPRYALLRGALPREYHSSVALATYAVWSYDTPIAWWLPQPARTAGQEAIARWLDGAEDGHWVIPAVKYSPTTTDHQWIVRSSLPDYGAGTDYSERPYSKFDKVPCGTGRGW